MTELFELAQELFTFQKQYGADASEILLSWLLLVIGFACIYLIRKKSLSIYWASFIFSECLIVSIATWYYLHVIEPFSKDTCGIYVARFQGDYGTAYRDEIFQTLKQEIYDAGLEKKVRIKKLPCRIWGKEGNEKARYWGEKGHAEIVIWGSFPSALKIWSWMTVVDSGLIGMEPLMIGPTTGIVLERKLSEVAVPEELIKKPLLLTNLTLAHMFIENGQYEKATKKLEEVISKEPNFTHGYFYLGNVYLDKELYDDAVKMFEKAVEIDSDFAAAYVNMGIGYYYKKCFKEGVEANRKAIEIDPCDHTAYYDMGVNYQGMGDFPRALKAYTRSLELRPEDPSARSGLISVCVKLGQPNKAIEIWKEITHTNPDYFFYTILGMLAMQDGQLNPAEQFLKKSVQLDKTFAPTYSALGVVYFRQGRLKDGLEMYLECRQKDSGYAVEIFKECRKLINSDEELARRLREQIPGLEGELKELAKKFLSEREK